MTDYIRIQQIRSPIRRHYSQRLTLKSLGLNKIGRTVAVRFNGPMWGMIQKVRHLIRFPDQELFEAHWLVLPRPEDEEADKALMLQLIFKGEGVELVSLPEKKTKTPDFKVMKNGELKGYCELKRISFDGIAVVCFAIVLKRGNRWASAGSRDGHATSTPSGSCPVGCKRSMGLRLTARTGTLPMRLDCHL